MHNRSHDFSECRVARFWDLLDFSPADPVPALAVSPTHPVPALVEQVHHLSPPVTAVPALIEQVHRLSPPVAVLENVLAFPDSENVGQEGAQPPQPGFMKRQHNPVDDVPGLWRVPLFGVLSPYYEVRKQQPMSMCRLGSLYSGLCSESFALTQMQIPHVIKFTCDSKEAAYNFMKENGVIGELHFLNVTDLLNPERPAGCIKRDTGELTEIFVPRGAFGELDVIVGGTSCRPNSAARTGRRSGAAPPSQHPEAFTTPAFIDMVALHEPLIAILENVLGMLFPESKQTTETPFHQLMQLCEEKTPQYSLCIFTLDHGIWMPWHRRRILAG